MLLSWLRPAKGLRARKKNNRDLKANRLRNRLRVEELETRVVPTAQFLGGVELYTDGAFTSTAAAGGNQITAATPVEVGLAPSAGNAFNPLLRLDGGVQFLDSDPTETFTTTGTVEAIVGGQSFNLFGAGTHSLSAPALLAGTDQVTDGSDLTVAGANFTFSTLGLTTQGVELQGSLSLPKLDGLNLAVTGNDEVVLDSTGISLTGLDASLTNASFSLAGLSVTAKDLAVHYGLGTNGDEQFTLSGDGSATILGQEVDFSLGTPQAPGIVIDNGTLQNFDAEVTTPTLSVGSLTFASSSLEVSYVAANAANNTPEELTITGSSAVTFGGTDAQTVAVQLGDPTLNTSGLVLENGALTSLDLAVTGDIHVAGLDLHADSLRATYSANQGLLTITGGADFKLDGNDVAVQLGDPTLNTAGLIIQNGTLQELDAAVTSDITIAGLTINTEALRVTYDAADNNTETITVTGSASIAVDSNSVAIQLGDTTDGTQGIVIQNGALTSFDATVTSDLDIAGLKITTDDLRVTYEAASAADNDIDTITVTGSASIAVDGNSVAVQLGDTTDGTQGIVIQNGALASFDATVTSDLDIAGLKITTDDLRVTYEAASAADNDIDTITVTGSASIAVDSNSVAIQLGDTTDGTQGIVIQNGALTSFDATVTSNLDIAGLKITTDDLRVTYEAASAADNDIDTITVTGSASIAVDGNSVAVQLGDTTDGTQGIVIQNGALASFDATVTSNLDIAGLKITTDDLRVTYEAASAADNDIDTITVTGSASIAVDGNSVAVQLGDTTDGTQGIVIQNGALASFDATVTSDLDIAGLKITTDDLRVTYEAASAADNDIDTITVTGSASIAVDGNSVAVQLGDTTDGTQGIVIQNGALASFDATVTSNLDIAGLKITTDDLRVTYEAASAADNDIDTITVTGSASIAVDGNSVAVQLGDTTDGTQGIVIQNGALASFDATVTSNLDIAGLKITTDDLRVTYEAASAADNDIDTITVTGSASIAVDGNSVAVQLGDTTDGTQGIVIQNGALTSFDATVTSDLDIAGLKITTDDLRVTYEAASAADNDIDTITVTGSASIAVDGNSVAVQLGDTTDGTQGIVIQNGALTSFDATVTSDLDIAGLKITTDDLRVTYEAASAADNDIDTITVTGSASIAVDGNSVAVQLGDTTDGTQGIVIQNGALASFDATVTSDLDIAGLKITTDDLRVTYEAASAADNDIDTITVTGSASIAVDSNSVAIQLGDTTDGTQGIVIQNGALTSFDATVTSNLDIAGLKITTDDLRVTYEAASAADNNTETITVTGSASIAVDGNSVAIQLGDTTEGTQGIVIQNGALASFDATVTSDLDIAGLKITTDDLRVTYEAASAADNDIDTITVTGSASIAVDGNSVAVQLGDTTDGTQGIVIQNGALASFDATVTSNLDIAGLKITTDDLRVTYEAASAADNNTETITVTGSASIAVDSNSVAIQLGDTTDGTQGIVIQNGALTSFDATVTSNLDIAGLKITTDDLRVTYEAASRRRQ